MSISDNTTKINQLITKINDLPAKTPAFQRVESSFVVNYVTEQPWGDGDDYDVINVDCGFKPDVVVLTDLGLGYEGTSQVSFILSGVSLDNPFHVYTYLYDYNELEYFMYYLYAIPTENGFKLIDFSYGDEEGTDHQYQEGRTYNYVAIKYT